MTRDMILEEKIRDLIKYMKDEYKWEFVDEEAIENTPKRIVNMLEEFYERRYRQGNLEKEFESNYDGLVIVKDIDFVAFCISGKEPIRMADGSIKLAKDVEIGDKVLTINEETKQVVYAEILDKGVRYDREMYIVRLKDGTQIKVTGDHPFYVKGKGFVYAMNLREGDKLLRYNLKKNSEREVRFNFGEKYWLGYFLGALMSDGNIWRNRIRWQVNSRKFADKIVESINRVFGKDVGIKEIRRKSGFKGGYIESYDITIVNGGIVRLLKSIIGDTNHSKQRLPEIVKKDEEVLRGFVDGYVDGDGHVSYRKGKVSKVVIYSYNREFLDDLAFLFGREVKEVSGKGEFYLTIPVKWFRKEESLGIGSYDEFIGSYEVVYVEVGGIERRVSKGKKAYKFYNFKTNRETFLVRDVLTHNCSHHFLPFYGKVHIGYFVRDRKKVMGVSKLARVVQLFANQPSIQEEMTDRIADWIMEYYDVDGVMVIVEGEHMCMKIRGVRSQNSKMITSALRGEFPKEEFLRLIGR